jgi:1,4-alpha-glucan branching enzyme
VWLNPDTEWTWALLYSAEDDFWEVARTLPWAADPWMRRVVAQMARELLLLQASDWQFLITTQAARDYAETRFAAHYADVTRLGRLARQCAGSDPATEDDVRFVEAKEAQDAVFPDIADTVADIAARAGARPGPR